MSLSPQRPIDYAVLAALAAVLMAGCAQWRQPPANPVEATPLPTATLPPTASPLPLPTHTGTSSPQSTASPSPPPTFTATTIPSPSPSPTPAVVYAAGDIASCGSYGAGATAQLIVGQPGAVLTLGDNAYRDGAPDDFANCYDPTWGQFKDRTYPAPGNHDYYTHGAAGYYAYFGPAAGDPALGYYSFHLGAWHLIALNSNCSAVGGCHAGSPQELWLRAELAANPALCTLAYWHHPLFNAGYHGANDSTRDLWQALYDAGAELVLNGHDHNYQRFAPLDPHGQTDSERGIRQFIVGTGGASLYPLFPGLPGLEVADNSAFGVLRLELSAERYAWEFVPEAGKTFTDRGSAACH